MDDFLTNASVVRMTQAASCDGAWTAVLDFCAHPSLLLTPIAQPSG